ncbi:MAG: endonuclease/exonuclease/phosphatase family protein [Cocleimonas sp.]
MIKVSSWNIQNGLGIDGQVSLERIAQTLKETIDPDVICLQEVSRNMPLADGSTADQVERLSELFPGYEFVFGAAIDTYLPALEQRGQFGNMILSRYPIKTVFHHPLPQPSDAGAKKHMARQLIEITVEKGSSSFRVMTTHLEFHSIIQRSAQSNYIMDVQKQVEALQSFSHPVDQTGPYKPLNRPTHCILCGDFNFEPYSVQYRTLTNPNHLRDPFNDAWLLLHPDQGHAATCGIYDHEQWPEKSHCRDFFFITDSLKGSLKEIICDQTSQASDHQPISISLDLDL